MDPAIQVDQTLLGTASLPSWMEKLTYRDWAPASTGLCTTLYL